MIVKTDFVPRGFDALTVWPFIFVRPEAAGNTALIAHEMVHFREQRAAWLLPWYARYLMSKKFRLAAEVRAYKVQIELGGITVERAAAMLLTYRLDISSAAALEALTAN